MRRFLFVGDPHATADELPDCKALVDLVIKTAVDESVHSIVCAGDLHHNHAVVHIDVLDFWRQAFAAIRSKTAVAHTIIMKGNHDEASTAVGVGGPHALQAYVDLPGVIVVDRPQVVSDIGFCPYYGDRAMFMDAARWLHERAPHTLMCHQTFNLAKFENGFVFKDGIDSTEVPQGRIISGHIHEPQEFGKVWYPGAPRHRSRSDANSSRAIWVMDFDDEGKFSSGHAVSTFPACREVRHTVVTNDKVVSGPDPGFAPSLLGPPFVPPNVVWHIDVYGSAQENLRNRMLFETGGFRVRCFDTDVPAPEVRESEGVAESFRRWLGGYKAKNGTPPEVLLKVAQERLGWAT